MQPPKIKDTLQKFGIGNPEVIYVGDDIGTWNETLNSTAKGFIASLISAINAVSVKVENENLKVAAVEDFAEKVAAEIEKINNPDNATEISNTIIEVIGNNTVVEVKEEEIEEIKSKIEALVENATNSSDKFEDLADELKEVISVAENATNVTVTTNAENVTDEEILTYLAEGRFNVVRTLLEGNTNSDAKKVAYALALLGISIDTNFLGKIGSYIIPGSGEGFDLYGFRNEAEKEEIDKRLEEVNLSEWKESVTSLVRDMEEAIKKLDEVSDTGVSIELCKFYHTPNLSPKITES